MARELKYKTHTHMEKHVHLKFLDEDVWIIRNKFSSRICACICICCHGKCALLPVCTFKNDEILEKMMMKLQKCECVEVRGCQQSRLQNTSTEPMLELWICCNCIMKAIKPNIYVVMRSECLFHTCWTWLNLYIFEIIMNVMIMVSQMFSNQTFTFSMFVHWIVLFSRDPVLVSLISN